MRQINFVIIFAACLALVLFGLENTEPVAVQIVEGVEVQAPLAIELIVAMGIGAVLAWIFSIWARLQHQLESRRSIRQIRSKDKQIEKLEEDIKHYKEELEGQELPALEASKALKEEALAE